jgi:hypothetical protein
MAEVSFVIESKPINVSHDTYKRECRYTRGIHIPESDFLKILDRMSHDVRIYFDFHNPGKTIRPGTYLNGYSGLAKALADFYEKKNTSIVPFINNGQDFYVKII